MRRQRSWSLRLVGGKYGKALLDQGAPPEVLRGSGGHQLAIFSEPAVDLFQRYLQ